MPMGKVVSIKMITLSVDYVDFEDRTSLGPGKQAPLSVVKVREGASKYKEWLVQQFLINGRSENVLLTLLRASSLPEEVNLAQRHETIGAKLYRKHLLEAYDHHGFNAIEKYLK